MEGFFFLGKLYIWFFFSQNLWRLRGHANMADRKSRSFSFKVPPGKSLAQIRASIENEITEGAINVFQQIGASEYLVELTDAAQVRELIENGFDAGTNHIRCHPPHGYYLNVSILGLKSYIDDEEVLEKLSQYGEVKSSVIRLKYRLDHELAGLENGNRLVRMVLTSPSIPYSLQIGREWCRIIHNNQQQICSNCNEPGHSRKNCPSIECRVCGTLGHISYHCPTRNAHHTENTDEESTTSNDNTENVENSDNLENLMEETEEQDGEQPIMDQEEEREPQTGNNTKWQVVSAKRPHQTDSDSEPLTLPRKQRIKPTPNLNAARCLRKSTDDTTKS